MSSDGRYSGDILDPELEKADRLVSFVDINHVDDDASFHNDWEQAVSAVDK